MRGGGSVSLTSIRVKCSTPVAGRPSLSWSLFLGAARLRSEFLRVRLQYSLALHLQELSLERRKHGCSGQWCPLPGRGRLAFSPKLFSSVQDRQNPKEAHELYPFPPSTVNAYNYSAYSIENNLLCPKQRDRYFSGSSRNQVTLLEFSLSMGWCLCSAPSTA